MMERGRGKGHFVSAPFFHVRFGFVFALICFTPLSLHRLETDKKTCCGPGSANPWSKIARLGSHVDGRMQFVLYSAAQLIAAPSIVIYDPEPD